MLSTESLVQRNRTLMDRNSADAARDVSAANLLSRHAASPAPERKEHNHPPALPHASQAVAVTSSLTPSLPSASAACTTFRNVSACNRCRTRKNRCDQRLPRCYSCEKAKVHCVGYDATTKREVPRSYLFFLESRVAYLEKTLVEHGIQVRSATAHEGEDHASKVQNKGRASPAGNAISVSIGSQSSRDGKPQALATISMKRKRESDDGVQGSFPGNARGGANERPGSAGSKAAESVPDVGTASVHDPPDLKHVGTTSGISFANVVFAAVKSSVSHSQHEARCFKRENKDGISQAAVEDGSKTMRDSFFNLPARPDVKHAALPTRELGELLAELYFEHENPQIPVLHRGDFMETLARVYQSDEASCSPKDVYTVFIVFAIGSGVNFGTQNDSCPRDDKRTPSEQRCLGVTPAQPEEYHASATVYLERFLHTARIESAGGNLDELQAILLLASFAILRPVPPGLWYIVGAAMRLAIDLGLHYEDGTGLDAVGGPDPFIRRVENVESLKIDAKERGRREWVRDLRRRLFWSCYVLDRLVSTCVNRPSAIPDAVITTKFPSPVDDKYITREGFLPAPDNAPSYKLSALHYVRLRLLQSEIQQVLHHQSAQIARQTKSRPDDSYFQSNLPCPYLVLHDSFQSWRASIIRRLDEWKDSAPAPEAIGVRFPVEFLELNYWQTVIMLYRQSLTVPEALAGEMNTHDDVSSPSVTSVDREEDEEDMYCKVAEAGRRVLRIYRQLHRVRMVNYTYLATHTLFMAGVTFLYAIWHSPTVRSRLTLEEVDLTILAATSVLGDLIHTCPPAEACRDAFCRMSEITVRMCLQQSGFGSQADPSGDVSSPPTRPSASFREHGYETPDTASRNAFASNNKLGRQSPFRVPRNIGDCEVNETLPAASTYSGVQPLLSVQAPQFQPPLTQMHNRRVPGDAMPPPTQVSTYAAATAIDDPYAEGARHRRDPSTNEKYPTPMMRRDQCAEQSSSRARYHCVSSPASRSNAAYGVNEAAYSRMVSEAYPGMLPYNPAAGPGTHGTAAEAYSYGAVNATNMFNGSFAFPGLPDSTGATGVDLGFGLAVDYQHDWSEGVGLDLLDGYFFGGNPS